ncbi:helix-turn-helix DNA-binding domain protein [Corynebacterium phage Colleen]|uniref:Uncharacterized protein n=4 Tax=root TaxID=1 RepID=W5Y500_9CORY|nr:hypothetical protein [Corynebacterium vitaeruminis]YP_009626552.1 hypothetical protein FDK28_gp40 [Corynebacterium phage Poushou]AWY06488.1 hypothetical protein PBI_TOUCHMENOT_40 [Corynebacterium phage TouchMeNot]QFG14789.1 helix-turn-helix DNA-binding domain protein [Corynebacterium phage Colleen]UVT31926.1 helix-turn-helix DNA binding domain protein [Corynebacterium phage Arianna]AHI21578.1 hypothetical protein B843_00910 [Corynebacterium vitaeruminis DSM 20294]ASJ78999.1 hypothetical pr
MNTTPKLPAFIRVAEFAHESGFSKKKTISMILSGELRARKLKPGVRNSPWMIPASELTRIYEEVAA